MTLTLHHAIAIVPLVYTVASLLGTIQKWQQAIWPLMLVGSAIWLLLGVAGA